MLKQVELVFLLNLHLVIFTNQNKSNLFLTNLYLVLRHIETMLVYFNLSQDGPITYFL